MIKAQQAVSITMAVPAGVKLISLSRGVSRHVSFVSNRYVDVTYVVVHSGGLGSMSDRFLEVRIMPVAMHNVPLLTVRLCTSDPNKQTSPCRIVLRPIRPVGYPVFFSNCR